jgi:predicted DNA-binding transcriptional regulator YafY
VELLPEEVQVMPDTLEGFLAVDLGPIATPDAEIFRRIVDALTRRRRVLMRYSSHASGRTLDRTADPYRVYNLRGDWYLAAWDHLRKEVRDFALHRIRSVHVLDESSVIDPRFRFEHYMRDAFSIEKGPRLARVTIRFSPRQARWIRERQWHPTARIHERRDGTCVLTMKVGGLGEVRRWAMQFGPDAEILSPRRLRRETQRQLSAALQLYKRSGGTRRGHPDRKWQGS